MTTHTLKVWPEFFDAIHEGVKTWEFRRDDRGFRVGDVLVLRCWSPSTGYMRISDTAGDYKAQRVTVTYILHGGRLGVPEGFCIMSIEVCRE